MIFVLPIAAIAVFMKGYGRTAALFAIFLAAILGWLGGALAFAAEGAVAAAVVAVAKPLVDLAKDVVVTVKKKCC